MAESKHCRSKIIPWTEPPKYVKMGLDVEAILGRKKGKKPCHKGYRSKEKQENKGFLPKIVKKQGTKMEDRKTYKYQHLSTVSLYHQIERDIRSLSRSEFGNSASNLPSSTSLLRIGIPYTVGRLKKMSTGGAIAPRLPYESVQIRTPEPLTTYGPSSNSTDSTRKEKIRKEILALIASKGNSDIGMMTNEQEHGEQKKHFGELQKGGAIKAQREHEWEYGDKEPHVDNGSVRKKETFNKTNLKKIAKNGTTKLDVQEDAIGEGSKWENSKMYKKSSRASGSPKPRFVKVRLSEKQTNVKPSLASLYHFLKKDLRSESAAGTEIGTLMSTMSSFAIDAITKVYSSMEFTYKPSNVSDKSYALAFDQSTIPYDWKLLMANRQSDSYKKTKKTRIMSRAKSLDAITMKERICVRKMTFSDICARIVKENPCEDGDYKEYKSRNNKICQEFKPKRQPVSRFCVAFEEHSKAGGLLWLTSEIISVVKLSKSSNIVRLIAEHLESKLDSRLIEGGDDTQKNQENPTDDEMDSCPITAEDKELATWLIYDSLRKRYCRKSGNSGNDQRSESSCSDNSEPPTEDDLHQCFNPAREPSMLSLSELFEKKVHSYKIPKKTLKNLCPSSPKLYQPLNSTMDLGEKEPDPNDEISYLIRILRKNEQCVDRVFQNEDEGKPGPANYQQPVDCPWWKGIMKQGKERYERMKQIGARDPQIWECHHPHGTDRISLLPPRKKSPEPSRDLLNAKSFVKSLCHRKRNAAVNFNCLLRKENNAGIGLGLLRERKKTLDVSQPKEALAPDKPSDFPAEGYQDLLNRERMMRMEMRNLKKTFEVIKAKSSISVHAICSNLCKSWVQEEAYEALEITTDKNVDDITFLKHQKEYEELKGWKSDEIILAKFINSILYKMYPAEILLNDYKGFNLENGVDYYNNLIIGEATNNTNLYDFLDTTEERDYVRMLMRMCQECPRLPALRAWHGKAHMFNVDEFLLETNLGGSQEVQYADSWSEFFKATEWKLKSDFGNDKEYFLDLEDPDYSSLPDEPPKPVDLASVYCIWQDLPVSVSNSDVADKYLEPKPLESLIEEWKTVPKKKKMNENEDATKITKVEALLNVIRSNTTPDEGFVWRMKQIGVEEGQKGAAGDAGSRSGFNVAIVKAEKTTSSLARYHEKSDNVYRTLEGHKNLDGMDERLEVLKSGERNTAKSKISVMFAEDVTSRVVTEFVVDTHKHGSEDIERRKEERVDLNSSIRKVFSKHVPLGQTSELAPNSKQDETTLAEHELEEQELEEREIGEQELRGREEEESILVSPDEKTEVQNMLPENTESHHYFNVKVSQPHPITPVKELSQSQDVEEHVALKEMVDVHESRSDSERKAMEAPIGEEDEEEEEEEP